MSIALVDCTTFYASCEKIFRPDLKDKPVVVLSNNDGCIIAVCKKAKALGIPRGGPLYQAEPLLQKHNVTVFSSNYGLYGDMSRRVMSILEGFSPSVEVYSIDEAFLDLSSLPQDPETLGRQIFDTVPQWTGIPVSVGIGPTKVLAKAANHRSKKDPAAGGVLVLTTPAQVRSLLENFPVEDIWGIGWSHTAFLHRKGITLASQLADCDDHWIQKHLHLPILNLVWELRGQSSLDLDSAPAPKEAIMCSRSFNRPISDWQSLRESAADYTSYAVDKLRRQRSQARVVTVHLTISSSNTAGPPYASSACEVLESPTSHTPTLVAAAVRALERIFRPGYRYKKTSVFLSEISEGSKRQGYLFHEEPRRNFGLMERVDQVKQRFGRHSLGLLGAGLQKTWSMSRSLLSPAYTTRWKDLAEAK